MEKMFARQKKKKHSYSKGNVNTFHCDEDVLHQKTKLKAAPH